MVEQLFGSKTRVKLLQLFYANPNRSFYVREITRKIDEQINSVRRELANLLNIGIIVAENTNNRLYYEVNQKYEFYKPLLAIFGSSKRVSPAPSDAAGSVPASNDEPSRLKTVGRIDLLLYTGTFTRDESAGIDVFVVGTVNQRALQKFIAELEAEEGRDLRYTVMTPDELSYRQQIKDRFVATVMNAKKQVLVDKNGIL